MKRFKKLLSTFLAVVFLVTGVGPLGVSAAKALSDVKGHWASDYIASGVDHGYINGYENGTFKPDNSVTRAEFCKMINNALDISGSADVSFTDAGSKDWYYDDVRRAVATGYISGYEDNTFRANNQISRQEASVVVSRIIATPAATRNISEMQDSASIAFWALDGAKTAYAKGYMAGDQNKRFNPGGNLTRAEAAKIIESILSGETIMDSDITISASNQVYSDTLYVGDVTISSGNNSNQVTFVNCRILGTMAVNGGEELILNNTGVNKLSVRNTSNDMTITAKGGASVNQTDIANGCNLEESSLSGAGFTRVILNGSSLKSNAVNLSGDFTTVTVASQSKLNLDSGTIANLVVASGGKSSTINLASKTTVARLEVNGACDFTGKGVIATAKLNVTGSSFETEPSSYEGDEGTLVPTVSPKSGATNVATNSSIKLTFSETLYNSSKNELKASYVESSVIELRKTSESGTKVSFSASLTSSNRVITITPDSGLSKNTKYYVILKAGSVKNNTGVANTKQVFTFSTVGGLVPEVYPVDGSDTIPVTANITLTFDENVYRASGSSSTMNAAYIEESVIELRKTSASGTKVNFTASISGNKVITIKPEDDLSTSSKYYIILKEESIANSDKDKNDKQTFSFTTASTSILVPVITPASGSTDVDVGTDIKLVFDTSVYTDSGSDVSASYLKSDVFTLRRSNSSSGATVAFTANISSRKTVTISPEDDLKEDSTYYLIMEKGSLANGTGSSRKTNDKLIFSFSTRSKESSGTLTPTPSPKNAATKIATKPKITLTFDEAIYQTGASNNTTKITSAYLTGDVIELRSKTSGGSSVKFSATIDSANKVITITPTDELTEDTRYYVIVTKGSIQNSSGKKNSQFTTYFTCGDSSGALKPSITPSDNTYGVSKDTSIELVFDEALYSTSTGDRIESNTTSKNYLKNTAIELRSTKDTGTKVAFTVDTVSSYRRITITPDKALTDKTTYYVVIPEGKLKNSSGTTNSKAVFSFTVGSGLQMSITPKAGATDVSRSPEIVLTFDDAIKTTNHGTVTESYVKNVVALKLGNKGDPLDLNVTIASNYKKITIAPASPLSAGTSHTFTLEEGAFKNSSGSGNAAISIAFTTTSSVLTPTVSPSHGSTGVSAQEEIKLSFGESLYYKTGVLLTASNVYNVVELRPKSESGTPIEFTATVSNSNKDITIKPTNALDSNTRYYVVLLADTLLNSSKTTGTKNTRQVFSFTTAAATGISSPAVSCSGVNSGGTHDIVLTFDDTIYQADGTSFTSSNAEAYIKSKFTLSKSSSGTSPVGFSVKMSSSNKVITLTTDTLLDANTTYYVIAGASAISGSSSGSSKNAAFSPSTKTPAVSVEVESQKVLKTSADIVITYNYPGKLTTFISGGSFGTTNKQVGSIYAPLKPTGTYTLSLDDYVTLAEGVTYTVTVMFLPTGGTTSLTKTCSFTTDKTSSDSILSNLDIVDDEKRITVRLGPPSNGKVTCPVEDGNVKSETGKVTVELTLNDSKSSIAVSGGNASRLSGGEYQITIPSSGTATVTITVTAENGSKTEYILTLTNVYEASK